MLHVLPPATVIDYLDRHSGALTTVLTVVLILVTAVYVLLNWRMVSEMEKARRQALMPKLALSFRALSANIIVPSIKNVGAGAALSVDVQLIYEPVDDAPRVERRWRANVIPSGGQHDFVPDKDLRGELRPPENYRALRLVGSMRDALGYSQGVDETFEDLPEWWELKKRERYEQPPEKRFAEAFAKEFKELFKALADRLRPSRS